MRKVVSFLVVAALIACTSCKKRTVAVVEEAWGTADYASAGVPAPDHAWTAAELTKAVEVLKREATAHPERLPRFGGAKSGPVFAALIGPGLPERPEEDVTQRLQDHMIRYEAVNAASKLYVRDLTAPMPREAIELYGALVREAVALRPLFDPFLATFPADDPKMQVRIEGRDKFDHGMASLLLGGIMTAGDLRLDDQDRIALLRNLAPAVPVLFAHMKSDQQESIRRQLQGLVDATSGGVHDEAVKLRGAMTTR